MRSVIVSLSLILLLLQAGAPNAVWSQDRQMLTIIPALGQPPPSSQDTTQTQATAVQSPAGASDSTTRADDPPAKNIDPAKSSDDSAKIDETAKSTEAGAVTTSGGTADKLLKGNISTSGKPSPLLYGVSQSIPKDTHVDVTFYCSINSEISQKGDQVWVKVSHDIAGSSGVGVPGGWYMHGMVTEAAPQKRAGRDGYVKIKFDKLFNPDGDIELPFEAEVSTKDKLIKTVAKTMAIDSAYMGAGAFEGALASVQLGGLPLAIASHGISVGVGAVAGATIGAIAAARREGNIACIYPGDELKMITAEPISLPGFNAALLPSAPKPMALTKLRLSVDHVYFSKDPGGDKRASLLTLDVTMNNHTAKEYGFIDLVVVSDHDQRYYPSIYGGLQNLKKKVKPGASEQSTVSFSVDGKGHKYWLVLLDKVNKDELTRVPIN